jgi:hypothetical protein
MRSKHLRTIYWTATLLFALPQACSALLCLIEAPVVVQIIASLGYPNYFVKLLAAAKLLGIAAILYGRFPVLKEWAYAGFTFEVLAAILSIWSMDGASYLWALPFAFLVLQLASYRSWTLIEARLAVRGPWRRRQRVTLPASASAMRGYY